MVREMRGRHEPKDLRPSLGADRSGIALVYITVMIPVIIAFALLAVDASRLYILSSSLQHGADAIALAMAAELNTSANALTRADRAKDNLVSNPATFTSTFTTIDGNAVTRRFLKSLPANDSDPITASNVATGDSDAKYVEVTVKPSRFDTIFPASFINSVGNFNTQAVAVAGLTPGACNIVPMFICNPLEQAGDAINRVDRLQAHVASTAERRKLFQLKSAGSASVVSPGNYGWLETSLGNGARSPADAISQAVPGACVTLNNLTTQTGNINSLDQAINVRFDMYKGSFSKSDSKIRPARNTRKSYTSTGSGNSTCSPGPVNIYGSSIPSGGIGFPRDSCQVGSTTACPLGSGDWNTMFTTYMTENFGSNPNNWPKKADGSSYTNSKTDTANFPTRYEVYRRELDSTPSFVSSTGSNPGMAYPKCYTGGATNDNPDRRLLNVAIVNCNAQKNGAGLSGGKQTGIIAAAFGIFFLSEPVDSNNCTGSKTDCTIYAELVNIVSPGVGSGSNGAIITDNVQLYR